MTPLTAKSRACVETLEPYRAVVSKSYIATTKLWNPL